MKSNSFGICVSHATFETVAKGSVQSTNDATAKREVTNRLCEWFGWKPGNIIDLGDISNSRGPEMFLALWVRLWGVLGTPHFNIHVIRGK